MNDRALDRRIAFLTLAVRMERVRRLVRILLEQRRMKFPNLEALPDAFVKLGEMTEADAKGVMADIEAAHEHRGNTMSRARRSVADIRGKVSDFGTFLDKVDTALGGNSGNPTSGNSSPASVDAQPREAAALNQGQPG